ncbi:MAG: hypothetical protein J1F03_07405 [Oscillospiraceae bacterium]|nr:hypothetical protein [Oscillospiraceae bacterium]
METEASEVTVCLDEDRIVINEKSVDIPSHIDVFIKLFGKPREIVCPKDDMSKNSEAVNKILELNLTTRRVNYAWDKLGLYCYTRNGSVVHTIGIRLNEGDICSKTYPTEFFKGEVTIKGMHWFEAVKKLPNIDEDMEFFKTLDLGIYTAIAEYADYGQDDHTRTEKDYTEIEVQLNRFN